MGKRGPRPPMPGAGRPQEYDRRALCEALKTYIAETDIPIFKEFCTRHGILAQTAYEWEEMQELLRLCTQKKESQLEKKALAGEVNVTQAIFSLKQLGWRDQKQMELSGPGGGPIETQVDLSGLTLEELRAIAKADAGTEGGAG